MFGSKFTTMGSKFFGVALSLQLYSQLIPLLSPLFLVRFEELAENNWKLGSKFVR